MKAVTIMIRCMAYALVFLLLSHLPFLVPGLCPWLTRQLVACRVPRLLVLQAAFFCWVLVIHYLWLRFFDPLYKIRIPSLGGAFIHYFAGMVPVFCIASLLRVAVLVFMKVPYQLNKTTPAELVLVLVVMGVVSFFISVGEELIFRQYILKRLEPLGIHWAVVLQAVLFGIKHYGTPAGLSWLGTTALVGLFLGYVRVYTNSLSLAIGCHSGFHLMVVLDFLFFALTSSHP